MATLDKLLVGLVNALRSFPDGTITSILGKFLVFSFANIGVSDFTTAAISFVFGAGKLIESTTTNWPSCAFDDKAILSAFRATLELILFLKLRSLVGPNVTPPPFHNGERIEPCRARPVPFCCHGFLPPPRTSLLPLAWANVCR